jgi:small GTP-binding protein
VLRLLSPDYELQLTDARDAVARLADVLGQFGATDDLKTLSASVRQLDDLFLLVVAGEFNAGKSALINALVGATVLEEGPIPTTAHLHLLKFGTPAASEVTADGVRVVTAPVELLRDVHIVDTPGTNAIMREHERLTTDFVPRADLVLFVTSADRPFTETERQFLATIRDWGKKIVILVNKVDITSTQGERDQVLTFVTNAARDLLGITPVVLGVSARLALRAKRGEPELWNSSGFEALERLLKETLQPDSRFRLKLANPLGVAQTFANRYGAIARERLSVLHGDVELLGDIERQNAAFAEDVTSGFELRLAAIGKILSDLELRGDRYFDATLRIGRVVDLLNRSRIQKEFTEQVIADTAVQIERHVSEMIDWLVDQDFRQWQAVTGTLTDRQREHSTRVLGAPEVGSFHSDRARLIDSVGREARRAVDTYDKQHEADIIADQARVAVSAAAAAGAAAVGLGTVVTIAASTVAADVTGILVASVVLGVGFLVIPARRRRAKAVLAEKVAALAERLRVALTTEFERARSHSTMRLDDAVAPYARFVRAEQSRWLDAQQTLEALSRRLVTLLANG